MSHIELAKTYIGKKEKPENSGFEDIQFEFDMISFGEWQKGFAWCACFAQMIFRKTFPEKSDVLKKLFDPSTRKTIENFKAAGYKVYSEPVLGSLVIWASYKANKQLWTGHAGIVSEVLSKKVFKSIEGNTAASGSRNGDRVAEHTRTTDFKPNGLNVMGFIQI